MQLSSTSTMHRTPPAPTSCWCSGMPHTEAVWQLTYSPTGVCHVVTALCLRALPSYKCLRFFECCAGEMSLQCQLWMQTVNVLMKCWVLSCWNGALDLSARAMWSWRLSPVSGYAGRRASAIWIWQTQYVATTQLLLLMLWTSPSKTTYKSRLWRIKFCMTVTAANALTPLSLRGVQHAAWLSE